MSSGAHGRSCCVLSWRPTPGRGRDAWLLLVRAAKHLEPLDAGLAREAYRDAFDAALTVGRLAARDGTLQVAEAARRAPRAPEPSRAANLLLNGLTLLITEGHAAGAPAMKRALCVFRNQDASAEETLRWLPFACRMSRDTWDDDGWYVLSARLIELARQAGALRLLPAALLEGVGFRLAAGEPAVAAWMAREARPSQGRRVTLWGRTVLCCSPPGEGGTLKAVS
jgi:hypothetical protein